MYAIPFGIFFFSFLRKTFFFPPAAFAIILLVSGQRSAAKARKLLAAYCLLLPWCFLLSDGCAARPLACARVRVCALSAHGKAATMTQTTICADVHQAFDVHLHALTQIAFNFALCVEDRTNTAKLVLAQIPDPRVNPPLRLVKDRGRARTSDSVNVCEADLRTFFRRKINTSYTSHSISPFLILDFR